MPFHQKIIYLQLTDANFHKLFKSNENDPFRITVMSLLEDGGLIDNNDFITDMWKHNWDANEAGMNETIQFWKQYVENKKAEQAKRIKNIQERIKKAAAGPRNGGRYKKRTMRKHHATKSRKHRR
jgi:hypothetical protein